VPARGSEVDELKATMQAMQKSMEQMQARIAELERENHKQITAHFSHRAIRDSFHQSRPLVSFILPVILPVATRPSHRH
jgi:uncharacterized membrane protein (DUF106 family)